MVGTTFEDEAFSDISLLPSRYGWIDVFLVPKSPGGNAGGFPGSTSLR